MHARSSFVCKLGLYLSYVSYAVSIDSLVLNSVDRFVATVFPMKVAMITGRIRAVLTLLTWVIPMGILYPIFQFTRKAEEAERPLSCATDVKSVAKFSYLGMFSVLCYCAALVIITILNTRIIKTLRSKWPAIQGNILRNTASGKRNQRVIKILIWIIVFFFICWTPNYVVAFLPEFSTDFKVYVLEILLLVCFYFLPHLSTEINPVIIFTFSTNYRQALKDCLRLPLVKCCSCFKSEQAARKETVELPELQAQCFWL